MSAILIFSLLSAALVWWAGRKDAARDPGLTTWSLLLLVLLPFAAGWLPKVGVLPYAGPRIPAEEGFSWKDCLIVLWALGAFIGLARLALAARGLARWSRESVLREKVGDVEIRELAGLGSPVAAGIFRKVVFVPERWSTWSPEARGMVLDHELAHHARRDPLRRWIAEAAAAVHWYNPLVRWMTARLTAQCEFACDRLVVRSGHDARGYATLLCDLAEDRRWRGPVLAMSGLAGLEDRVKRLGSPAEAEGRVLLVLLIGGLMCAAAGVAVVGPREPEEYTDEEIELRWSADPFPGN